MKKICFIGAPGVGKSFIYELLKKARKKNQRWLTLREAKIEIAKNHSLSGKPKNILFELLLRSGLFKKYYSLLSDLILKNIKEESFEIMRSKYSPLFDIACRGLNIEVKDPVNRMAGSAFFLNIAKDEILIDKYFDNRIVIYDDSIWQSLRGVRNYFRDADEKLLLEIPKPDAVIYCYSRTDNIYSRIKQREKRGKLNTCHYNLTEEELYLSIEMDIENARLKAQLLQAVGVKVLNVNSEDDLLFNINLIKDFLASIH